MLYSLGCTVSMSLLLSVLRLQNRAVCYALSVCVFAIPLIVCQVADPDRSARCGAAGSRGQDGVLHLLSEPHRG